MPNLLGVDVIELIQSKKSADDIHIGLSDPTFAGWISKNHFESFELQARDKHELGIDLQYDNGVEASYRIKLGKILHDEELDGTLIVDVQSTQAVCAQDARLEPM